MNINNSIENILDIIQNATTSQEFINIHKRASQDFTRNRSLNFKSIIDFVLGNLGTSLDFEAIHFCAGYESITPAALSKARDKIKYTAFEELLHKTAKSVPIVNTFKGYRLLAFDGLKGELPRTIELMRKYVASKKSSYPQFHAVAAYDVLNCCYMNAVFKPGTTDERSAALEILETHDYSGAEIFIFDRGFPSLKLIQKIEVMGKSYVIRVSKSFLREVNDFGQSKLNDAIVDVNYDKRRGATNRVVGVELPFSTKIRCLRIELESGESEILITNLAMSEFSRKEIGEIYNLRWKIETGFLNLKYAVRIEDFMGIKENSIKQEFYASLIKSNLFMQFIGLANNIIYSKKNDKTRICSEYTKSGLCNTRKNA